MLQPGLQSTIQDWPGRIGHWCVGIPPSGPMDERAFRLANGLLGNPQGMSALEFQLLGPKLSAGCDIDIAVIGGSAPTLDAVPFQTGKVVTLRAGQVLDCGIVQRGARGYLAVAGGFRKELVLGSAATFPRGGIGGRALAAGEALLLASPTAGGPAAQLPPDATPTLDDPATIEVTAGPHLDWLSAEGIATLVGAVWTVSSQSDRTGIRLSGPSIAFSKRAFDKAPENGPDPTNVINTGYAVGGVNLCGGTPIILPVDGPSQGGFITPVVVPSAAMWKVGQLRPNRTMMFRRVTLEEAIAMRQTLDATIASAIAAAREQREAVR
ncbi:MAG TPA: biotin-dependent carboxyltransferase family protein [Bauldia sp.]|nr:biotin-dependent carboxyltransferase family protein [Bauldia sp.]